MSKFIENPVEFYTSLNSAINMYPDALYSTINEVHSKIMSNKDSQILCATNVSCTNIKCPECPFFDDDYLETFKNNMPENIEDEILAIKLLGE